MARKTKGKTWFTIISPKFLGEKEIGRTLVSDPKALKGRKVVVALTDLVNNLSKYYMKLIFKIEDIKDSTALTSFDGSECLHDYISRMVLKRTRRVDAVQDLKTKDGVSIRVKSIAIIPKRVKSSIKRAVRDKIREVVKDEVESVSLEEFVENMISDKLRKKVLVEARKVYPVRNFEIRKTEVLGKFKSG